MKVMLWRWSCSGFVVVLLALVPSLFAAEPPSPRQSMPKLGEATIRPNGELEIRSIEMVPRSVVEMIAPQGPVLIQMSPLVPVTSPDRIVPVPTTMAPVESTPMMSTPAAAMPTSADPMVTRPTTNNILEERIQIVPTGEFWVLRGGHRLDAKEAASLLRVRTPVVFVQLGKGEMLDPFYLQFFKPDMVIVGISASVAQPIQAPGVTGFAVPILGTSAPGPGVLVPTPAIGPSSDLPEFVARPSSSYQPRSLQPSPAKPQVKLDRLLEMRSAEELEGRLEVELRVTGVYNVAGYRCRVEKAVDDTGADLVDRKEHLGEPTGFDGFGNRFRLKPPARKATMLKEVSAVVEMIVPERDPKATVAVTGFVGKPRLTVSHPSLTAAGASVTILNKDEYEREQPAARKKPAAAKETKAVPSAGQRLGQVLSNVLDGIFERMIDNALDSMFAGFGAMGDVTENSVIVSAEDPNDRVLKVEFFDSSGRGISPLSYVWNNSQYVYNFTTKLPDDAQMRIVLATSEATVRMPFTLKDIPLP